MGDQNFILSPILTLAYKECTESVISVVLFIKSRYEKYFQAISITAILELTQVILQTNNVVLHEAYVGQRLSMNTCTFTIR